MRPFLLLFLLLSFAGTFTHAQQNNNDLRTTALGRRILNRNDTIFTFYVLKPDEPIKTYPDRLYYWFKDDTVLTTTGGFDGWLLDGSYKVFYPQKSLREEGSFHNGLKEGEWKSWYVDGRLQSLTNWKKGIETGLAVQYTKDGKQERMRYKNGKRTARQTRESKPD